MQESPPVVVRKFAEHRHCGAVERESKVNHVGQVRGQRQKVGHKIDPRRGTLPSAPFHEAKGQEVHQEHRRIEIDQGREIKAQPAAEGPPHGARVGHVQQIGVHTAEYHPRKKEHGQRKQQAPEQESVDRSGKVGKAKPNHGKGNEGEGDTPYILDKCR